MVSNRSLEGRVALVTGASRGIGEATSHALAEKGADVALLARSDDILSEVAADLEGKYGVQTLPLPTNVRSHAEVTAAVEDTVDQFGGLDIVVNNAGITGDGFDDRMEEASIENFHRLMEINVFGMYYVTHAAMPYLRERKGNLVFIGSSAGKLPRPGAPVYAGSKWWTRGFALSVEAHAGQDGVAVTLINPTAVRSQIWHDELGPGEAAEPEEVADVVVFAAEQEPQTTLSEVDLFRRDLLGKMVPREIELDLAYDFD